MSENNNVATGRNWTLFFIALIAEIIVLVMWPEWCWVPLPFLLTYLVTALRVI